MAAGTIAQTTIKRCHHSSKFGGGRSSALPIVALIENSQAMINENPG